MNLPKALKEVGERAFRDCQSLAEVKIPYNTSVWESAFESCGVLDKVTLEGNYVDESAFLGTTIKRLVFSDGKEKRSYGIGYWRTKSIGTIQVGSHVRELGLSDPYLSAAYTKPLLEIGKIIVNGKSTKLSGWQKKSKLDSLYTVPGAKCINWAKKHRLTYQIKTCGKTGRITKKKTNFSWKKVKTTVIKYTYKKNDKKWKKSTKKQAAQYKVFGKNKKGSAYKFIRETSKNCIKSKYRYLKVEPVNYW